MNNVVFVEFEDKVFKGFLFVLLCSGVFVDASKVIADTVIPEGVQIQPPTRFVWSRNSFETRGLKEDQLASALSYGYVYYSSYLEALEYLRKHTCNENEGVWLCHDNQELPFFPGYDGWIWGYKFCRPYEQDYCGWQATSRQGICPPNTTGYQIKDVDGTNRYGYIACSVSTEPDGEKDLAKPADCGDRTPNPVYIALGRKELTIPVYNTNNDVYPLNFKLFYQHNDRKRSGATWRHTYYKFIVVDGRETPTSARVYRGRGALLFYKDQANGEWQSDDDINDSLAELFDENNDRIGWLYLDRFNDRVERYDTTGKLVSIENRSGQIHTLIYNGNGRLLYVIDTFGRQLQFTYDEYGNFASLIDPSGNTYLFNFEENGNLTSITYPDSETRAFHYNEPTYTSGVNLPHALTGITDENGVRYATYTYDAQGRAIITEYAGGVDRYELNYVSANSTVVTDPLGSQYTHQFQNIMGVAKSVGQSQPAGSGCSAASSAMTYDINGNIASRADFNGNMTCYAYDLDRNLEIARVEGLSSSRNCPADVVSYTPVPGTSERKILTSWHTNFRLPVQVVENDRVTTITYDTYGNVTQLSIRDTMSNEERTWNTGYMYHSTFPGVIVQRVEDGPRTDVNDITTIDYYAPDAACFGGHLGCRGQVMRITNALGHVTEITRYNAHGQTEQIVDPNNLITTMTYNARRRLISRVVGSETTTYQYDSAGQLIRLTRPDNSSLYYTYDAAHRLTGITDGLGNVIRYTLDAAGNRTKEEIFDANNTLVQVRQQEFDTLNRLWKMVGAQNQVIELAYDANGNVKQTVDPLLHTSTRHFDTLDRLVQISDPMSGQTLQMYDALDRITQVVDPKGIATRYTRNAFGNVTQEISQDRGTTMYSYDQAGNQLTKMDARGVVQATAYDALNRPISRSYTTVTGVPQTGSITWVYDNGTNGVGRMTRMGDESGSTGYQYDAHGRVIRKTQTVVFGKRNLTHSISYQYSDSGQLMRISYPSGAKIDYVYGKDGKPIELHINGDALMRNIVYRPFGEPEGWDWGNDQQHRRSFDLNGRLTGYPLAADTQTLVYDAANRIVNTTHTDPINNRTYEYDALGRLIRQTDGASTRLWDYDANSNRTFEQSGTTVYPYIIDTSSNRLLNVAGPVVKNYAYDAAGNITHNGQIQFTWNAAGRLKKIINGDKVRKYKYNGFGERVRRNGRKKRRFTFFYDPGGRLISQFKANNIAKENWRLQQETIWFNDIPVAVIKQVTPTEPVQVYMIHADHLNTPRAIVDSTNMPVWLWRNRNAFGDNLPDEDPDGDGVKFKYNLRFAGQYFDAETQLHYNYFRDYEPATGRYISSDPIGLVGGVNTFGYALQNPLTYVDPDGKQTICAIWPLGTLTCVIASIGVITTAKKCSDGVNNVSEAFKAVDNLKSLKEERINCISERLCNPEKEQALQDDIYETDSVFRKNTVEAINNLGASVPGTTMTGPIPTKVHDVAAGTLANIKIPE
ncbi:RHS repeat protein [Nitrosomonas marina]|nr:RHS repeat protein [Nitrosomonas marina]